jgi:arsenite methyltransferase
MNHPPPGRTRPDYGVDGYPYLIGLSAAALVFGLSSGLLAASAHPALATALALLALLPAAPAVLGLRYVSIGKLRYRDRLLDRIAWQGDERVLDVGTGGGVLLIGAAKRLSAGRAFGIDVWSTTDLSGNTKARLLRNAALEGVAQRIEVRDDDARSLSFDTASFDVVLSVLCLHNIDHDREQALLEMVRVLRPGGTILVSDLAGTAEYSQTFAALGLTVDHRGTAWGTFPFPARGRRTKARLTLPPAQSENDRTRIRASRVGMGPSAAAGAQDA